MAKHKTIKLGRLKFDLADITVEPVLFLYMFTNFLYFPTLQALIFNKVCLQKYIPSYCDLIQTNKTYKDAHEDEVRGITSETSYWILRTTIALTGCSFFMVTLLLGPLGDKFGRKLPVILPCLGAFAAALSGLLNAKYMSASLYYILIGPILNGLLGGYIACIMSVYSYLGHVVSPSSKLMRIGIAEALVFFAGTTGVFVSGVMLDKQGYIFTFSVLCVTLGLAMVYAVFWLDNILPTNREESQDRSSSKCEVVWTFFKDSFQCAARPRENGVFISIVLQIITLDVLMLCTSGDMDIALLYLKKTFGFSQTLFGFYKGLDNFLRGLALLTVLPLLRHWFGLRNLSAVMVGLVSYAGGFILLGLASNKWLVFLSAAVGCLKGFPSAGLRASMSAMVSSDEQGRLFGIVAASESLVALLASLLFNDLYPATQDIMPGLCYLVAASLIIIVFFVTLYVRHTLPVPPEFSSLVYEVIQEERPLTDGSTSSNSRI